MQVGKGGDPGELVIIAGHDEPLDPLLRQFPCLTSLDRQGGDGASRVNSAHRVRALHDAITVGPDLTRMLGNLGGAPVLLVDDYADTGWTVALASRALRRAGSGRILPFVLAVAGAR